MVYVHEESVRRHDSHVLEKSTMEVQLSVLTVNGGQPVEMAGDKAYGVSPNIRGRRSKRQLQAMGPVARLAAKAEDARDKIIRDTTENSFNQQVNRPLNGMSLTCTLVCPPPSRLWFNLAYTYGPVGSHHSSRHSFHHSSRH